MTVIAPPPTPVQPPDLPGRVVLRGVSWSAYRALRESLGDSPVHLTYDDGFLEIEVPSKRHEQLKKLAAALAEALLDATRTRYQPLGATTWDREEILKAIEADECYYVRNVGNVKNLDEADLTIDPPPDLAIEVEVSSGALDKLRIYSALGVPEVWRIRDDATLRILRRNTSGGYDAVSESAEVPGATVQLIEAQLKLLRPTGALLHSEVLERFRESIRR
jgi:Uma2 family endonuclease